VSNHATSPLLVHAATRGCGVAAEAEDVATTKTGPAMTAATNAPAIAERLLPNIPRSDLNIGISLFRWSKKNRTQRGMTVASNLTDTNLTGANLSDSNLNGCVGAANCPSGAGLVGANFTGADFLGATFSRGGGGVTLGNNTWSNTTCPDGTNSDSDGSTCINNGA
jgi:hypothetical protein